MENTTVFNASFNNGSRSPDDYSRDPDGILSFYAKIRYTSGVLTFLLSPVVIVVNLALIITILTNRNLRKEFRQKVMVSIALADLLIGLVSCPIRGDMLIKMDREGHSCATYLVFSVIEEYVQMFVGTWGIVTINFEYLLSLFCVNLPKLSPLKEKLCVALILALPWLAMVFLVLPVAYAHAREDARPFQWCYLFLPISAKQIVYSFTFAIPGIIIVSQSITMIVYNCLQRNNRTPSLMSSTETIKSPWVFVIVGVVTVVLVGIEQSGHMAWNLVSDGPAKPVFTWYFISTFLSDSKSAVTPLIWFAFQELRNAFMDLLKKLPCVQVTGIVGTSNDTVADYKNFSDDSV